MTTFNCIYFVKSNFPFILLYCFSQWNLKIARKVLRKQNVKWAVYVPRIINKQEAAVEIAERNPVWQKIETKQQTERSDSNLSTFPPDFHTACLWWS